MAKKRKLLAALDAHNGRDHRLEGQKKQQKRAAKKKYIKGPGSDIEGKEAFQAQANGTSLISGVESDGWQSDESRAAKAKAVCGASTTSNDSIDID